MSIRNCEVSGLRSLRHVEWMPGKLNVLIGPNGSGKSNLLQALELLQKAAVSKLSDEILRQGGIAPLLWDGQAHSLSWTLSTKSGESASELDYRFELKQMGNTSAYRVEREILKTPKASMLERKPGHAELIDPEGERVQVPLRLLSDEESILYIVANSIFAGPLAARFQESIAGWSFYHDMRVDRDSQIRQATVARHEKTVSTDGQNLIAVLHTLYTGSRDFKKSIDAAMRAAFGADYEELAFPPAADQRIQMRLRWRSLKTEQSAANLSDGTLRFLMITAILANPEPGDLIAIDEPETGLHPSMFPIIAELAAEAAERTQVIFTTHSPQFLDAFGDNPPTTTVTEWTDGETHLSVLDGEELERWLRDYSLGTLFRSGELGSVSTLPFTRQRLGC